MLTGEQLVSALNHLSATVSQYQGTAYRAVSPKRCDNPLDSFGSILNGGRYNTKDIFEVLYLGVSGNTACIEYRNRLIRANGGFFEDEERPCKVFTVEYRLNTVLDITNLDNQDILGTSHQELTGNWNWYQRNVSEKISPTQILGKAIYDLGTIVALKVPSAPHCGAHNIIIFPEILMKNHSLGHLRARDPFGIIDVQFP